MTLITWIHQRWLCSRNSCHLTPPNDFTNITNNWKWALFLSCCGTKIFKMARALLASQSVQAELWDTLQEKLWDHYTPSLPTLPADTNSNQAKGEFINKYMAALREAALYCEFHGLDNALLDWLVRDIKLQWHLLTRQNPMPQMVMEEAQAAETSSQSTVEIQRSNSLPASWKTILVHHKEVDQRVSMDEEETVSWQTSVPRANKIHITIHIEGSPCQMDVDTGSVTTIVSWRTIQRLMPHMTKRRLTHSHICLRDYQRNSIPILGSGIFQASFKKFSGQFQLIIVNESLPSLLRLDWFASLWLGIT
ncbi:hypothetical protein E2320_002230, partial [Naja naja]